jgi:hypothetical protein
LKYFTHKYENRIMKPIQNCFKVRKGDKKKKQRVNLIKAHYMHVWKYHNEPPLYSAYMLIKKRKKVCL